MFNQLSQHFLKNIYGGIKGEIRLAILIRDLTNILPMISADFKQINVLDLGGGAGQMAIFLANLGCKVCLVDSSQELLNKAKENAKNLQINNITFVNQDIFVFAKENNQFFDLVLCHAVLEWVEDGEELLQLCVGKIKNNGYFSLLTYNKNALFFAQHVFGNFDYLDQNLITKKPAKLTPKYPRDLKFLFNQINNINLKIVKQSNIRCFYDYMKKADADRHSNNRIIEYEINLSDQLEYQSVARYLHFLLQKNL